MENINLSIGSSDKFKERWDSTSLSFERDRKCGLSWPQKNYTCSFCKKQFKSAQALGGHMNVHRRDRAKLRQSPSWDCPNFNPNPNPNFSSSPAARFLPYISYHSSLNPPLASFCSQSSSSTDEVKTLLKPHSLLEPVSLPGGDLRKKTSSGAFLGVRQLKSFMQEEECRVFKKKENIVRLELGMSLVRDTKEDLDLKLRLGYS